LEFNVPFQHKYGYIRDEVSYLSKYILIFFRHSDKCHGVKIQAHWYADFIIIKQSLLALSVQNTVNCPVHKQNCQDQWFPEITVA